MAMKERSRACRFFVAVGVTVSAFLFVFTVVGHVWNVCYVGPSGYSLYVGNGYVEYGYGWGWIRRRMFHDGRVEKGWKLKRTLPALAGTVPVDIPPSIQVPVWFCTVISIGATYALRRRGRLWEWPELYLILFWLIYSVTVMLFYFLVQEFFYIVDVRFMEHNTLSLAIGLSAVLVLLPCFYARIYRRHILEYRIRHGLCVTCRYNLTGNVSGICPECGTPIRREIDARNAG